jgi:hypothetical protein
MPSVNCSADSNIVEFPAKGQGVFIFEKMCETAAFSIFNAERSEGLSITLSNGVFRVCIFSNAEVLLDTKVAPGDAPSYWFSLDAQNQRLYGGVGEPRLETAIYQHVLTASTKKWLEALYRIEIHTDGPKGIRPIRILRDPVTDSVPLRLKDTAGLTMEDVASAAYMPVANLPATAQKLYNCIAGPNFTLNTPDFPDFYQAIENSIRTPGLWCYETLKKKSTEFNKDANILETYLRITLGQNNGESPGVPYVMEIWPAGHFSPVHSHAGAEAVIRVLEGGIHVDLFPFLKSGAKPFGSGDFTKGDVMWISPTLNQTHQLTNEGKNTCVTIQCYMYDETDNKHYDYFDYLDANGVVQQYEPDSDMDFMAFKKLIQSEWKQCECLPIRRLFAKR